jgi:predicted transcriptional regulator of viral defense system
MRMTGQMRDFSKAECLRVAGLIQRQVEAGNVERVQRGHYRLIAVDQDQETDEPAAA